jgi:hypothetical protein
MAKKKTIKPNKLNAASELELNLRGTPYEVSARKIWQQLFDFYRTYGGPLHDMDNMLVDLKLCYKLMEDVSVVSDKIEFFWGFASGWTHGYTTWLRDVSDADAKATMESNGTDWYVKCEVTRSKALFKVYGSVSPSP